MDLADTQTLLTTALIPPCSATQRTDALQLIRKNDHIPAALALRIYSNNVSGARIKSLAAAYPACFRILGEVCFNNIAYRFIEHTPSVQPDLNRYGKAFSGFLDEWTQSQASFSDYRYLGDLARVERVDADTCEILAACQQGMALEYLIGTHQDHTSMIHEILPKLIQRGWITAMTVDKTGTPGNP